MYGFILFNWTWNNPDCVVIQDSVLFNSKCKTREAKALSKFESLIPLMCLWPQNLYNRLAFGNRVLSFVSGKNWEVANESIKRPLYSCPQVFVSLGIVSVYKSCFSRYSVLERPTDSHAHQCRLVRILLSTQLPTQDLFVSRVVRMSVSPPLLVSYIEFAY